MTTVSMYTGGYSIPGGSISYVNPEYLRQVQEEELQNKISGTTQENKGECTDGKDDGKIGFFSAIGHAIKGGIKAIGRGIKSMFTNKEGKFSLGRTLLSIGLIATSFFCPVVGVVLAGAGLAAGVFQAGKGVVNAMNAKTDAKAKEAWENVGGGVTTAIISRYALKSSYAAMQSGAAVSPNGSALERLGEDATFGAKAKAFMTDAKSSTIQGFKDAKVVAKNGIHEAGTTFKTVRNKVKNSEFVNHPKTTIKNSQIVQSMRHPVQTIENGLANLKNVKFSNIKNSLSESGKKCWQVLVDEDYPTALHQYGYNTVLEVLAIVEAEALATSTNR